MKQSRMLVQNWVMVGTGIFLMYFGFFLVSFVKLNYEGVYALVSMSTIVAGILMVLLGLWLGFEKEEKKTS